METPGFQNFDMEGCTRLRVEARMWEGSPQSRRFASLRVQGTDDGSLEKKTWVDEGDAIPLLAGTWERRTLSGVRRQVRVVDEARASGAPGRIEIRLTRLP
jgi:hypothetical protein